MKKNFSRALAFVLAHEGGYVNHPDDPGGETKYGISKRSYPKLDIKSLTKRQAADIYKRDYWDRTGGDVMPFPYDVLVFDAAVQHGVGRANRWVGQATTGRHFLFIRLEFYAKLKHFNKFGRGWVTRLVDLFKLVEEMKQ